MGKATIVSGGDDGKYQVRLDYGKTAQTERLAAIAARLAELVGLIAQALQDLNTQEYTGAQVEAEVEAGINAYVATAQALAALPADTAPAVLKAVQDAVSAALKTHTEALTKLAAAVRKTAPLRLAWQALKAEQVQLQKDQAKWAALVLEETVQAWCADLTETATGEVATVEIPGENKLVLIAPAAPVPTAAYGVLTAREVQTPAQVFFNAAILPGWQKYMPTYRRGVITAVNEAEDKADVTLEALDKSSAQNLVINQAQTLAAVPVEYMTCNAGAFAVGDKCIVRFEQQDWAKPRVVGFVDNPKSCAVIYSGVTKGGDVVLLPVPPESPPNTVGKLVLRSYKPTQNAWEYPLRSDPAKSPLAFNDEPRLVPGGNQYAGLNASSYSGLMAKVVQVLMGMGRPAPYVYAWARGHGVVLATDGKPWLVEISQANGVLAMALPMTKGRLTSPTVAEAQTVALLGGVPTGAAFPAGAALTAARSAGAVITLAEPADMAPFFEKRKWAAWLGWSFDATGREAQNTCYEMTGDATRGYLYRLAINISPGGDGVYVGSAVLTELSSGLLERVDTATHPFSFAPLVGDPEPLPIPWVPTFTTPGAEAPLFVRHDGTAFDVVRLRMQQQRYESSGPPPGVSNPGTITTSSDVLCCYPVSDKYAEKTHGSSGFATFTKGSEIVRIKSSFNAGPPLGVVPGVIVVYNFSNLMNSVSRGPRYGAVVEGMRDGYVFYDWGVSSVEVANSGISSYQEAGTGGVDSYDGITGSTNPIVTSTFEDDITRIALPNGAPTIVSAPALDSDTRTGFRYLWENTNINRLVPRGPLYAVRASVFGESPHAQHSASIWSVNSLLNGSMLEGEATPTNTVYNFVGYL